MASFGRNDKAYIRLGGEPRPSLVYNLAGPIKLEDSKKYPGVQIADTLASSITYSLKNKGGEFSNRCMEIASDSITAAIAADTEKYQPNRNKGSLNMLVLPGLLECSGRGEDSEASLKGGTMTQPAEEKDATEGPELEGKEEALRSVDGIEAKGRHTKTTTRELLNPRLEIGGETFSGTSLDSAQVHLHEEKSSGFISASVTLNPPVKARWDYHAESRLCEDSELQFVGNCSRATHQKDGALQLTLSGPAWYFDRTILQYISFLGMAHQECVYWLEKFTSTITGTIGSIVEGLELNTTLRPFMYAVPLKNLKSSGKGLVLTTDTGIDPREYENILKPILTQTKEIKEETVWTDDTPKIFGTVFADNLLQADHIARGRAEFMVGIINLALRTGMSHFETRYSDELLEFDAVTSLEPVSLHPWIIIRETSHEKGWIRKIPTARLESEISLDDSLDRIRYFMSKLFRASESGDVHDQQGRRQLSAREQRLSSGIKRALRWLNIASREDDEGDRFTATWIALESILNSITYPGVFDGRRATLKVDIRRELRKISLPSTARQSLAISTNMLENRILQNSWSLPRKLTIFAESLGINLKPDDEKLVGMLSRARSSILHGGDDSPSLPKQQVDRLSYLVERLAVGASIGGYEDLEDGIHEFRIGTIAPEGGDAPISIDGTEDVPYERRNFKDDAGQLKMEWIAEGKIYSDKNMKIL